MKDNSSVASILTNIFFRIKQKNWYFWIPNGISGNKQEWSQQWAVYQICLSDSGCIYKNKRRVWYIKTVHCLDTHMIISVKCTVLILFCKGSFLNNMLYTFTAVFHSVLLTYFRAYDEKGNPVVNSSQIDYLEADPNLGLVPRIWRSLEKILYGLVLLLSCKLKWPGSSKLGPLSSFWGTNPKADQCFDKVFL